MNLPTVPLALLEQLQAVHLDPAAATASVGSRELTADSPRQLRRILANALYEVLHTGQEQIEGPRPYRIRDEAFERVLAAAVPHRETIARVRLRALAEPEGAGPVCLVELEGVRVWAPRGNLRPPERAEVGELAELANTARRPALSPGFFLVQGTRAHRSGRVLRVYVHIPRWQDAAAIWGAALAHLERSRATYRAKVLSARELYPRRDALVVYLDPQCRHHAPELAELLADLPGVGAQTSVFAHRLGPGIAAAWEPDDRRSGMAGMSFGQHRASLVAEALMDAAEGSQPLVPALVESLRAGNVNPEDLALNVDSAAIISPAPAMT
jgi:hypothetical protein